MIRRIAHVCLATKDLAATEHFYCDVLGLRKQFNFIRGGKVAGFYFKVAEGNFIEVFRQDEIHPAAGCPIGHLCLEVDHIDAVAGRLKSSGYDTTDKLLGGDKSWQIWTTDPSGVRIEFHQYTADSTQITGKDCIID